MARPLRMAVADGWYHVFARGLERREIFRDDADRRHLLELFGLLQERFRILIHAYALMDNHGISSRTVEATRGAIFPSGRDGASAG